MKKKREKIILLLLTVLLGLIVYFLILPTAKEIKNSLEEIKKIRANVISLEEKKTQLKKLEPEREVFKNYYQKIEKAFVDPSTPLNFLVFLEETSKKNNLSLRMVFLPPDRKDTLKLQIIVLGRFSHCLRFLEEIKNGPFLISFSSINVNKLTQEQLEREEYQRFSTNDVEASIIIDIYTK